MFRVLSLAATGSCRTGLKLELGREWPLLGTSTKITETSSQSDDSLAPQLPLPPDNRMQCPEALPSEHLLIDPHNNLASQDAQHSSTPRSSAVITDYTPNSPIPGLITPKSIQESLGGLNRSKIDNVTCTTPRKIGLTDGTHQIRTKYFSLNFADLGFLQVILVRLAMCTST